MIKVKWSWHVVGSLRLNLSILESTRLCEELQKRFSCTKFFVVSRVSLQIPIFRINSTIKLNRLRKLRKTLWKLWRSYLSSRRVAIVLILSCCLDFWLKKKQTTAAVKNIVLRCCRKSTLKSIITCDLFSLFHRIFISNHIELLSRSSRSQMAYLSSRSWLSGDFVEDAALARQKKWRRILIRKDRLLI